MTIADTKALFQDIAAATSDPETAHERESRLRSMVLRSIATSQAESPHEMAAIALSTDTLVFPRWFA